MGSGEGLSSVVFIISVNLLQANIIHQTGIQIKNTKYKKYKLKSTNKNLNLRPNKILKK